MRPLIALLTDFGTADHYAGTMKGVILGICPDVTLVDITHDIAPHDVTGGAMSWVMSTRVTSGQMPRITPFIVPA